MNITWKRNHWKHVATLLLAVLLVAAPMSRLNASAAGKPIGGGDAGIQSTMSFTGPLPNARQVGTPYEGRLHGNYTTSSLVVDGIARITDLSYKFIATTCASLVKTLLTNSTNDIYYIRTEYLSKDGDMCYFKYDFYKNANYTGYLGTTYSYVISLWY